MSKPRVLSPAQLFDKYAVEYDKKYQDISLYHSELDEVLHLLGKSASVLELGCGPGNITRYMLQKRPDLNWLGTDISPNMIKLAETNNPTANFRVFDSKEIMKLEGKYDAIICGFCLPYLNWDETKNLISDSYQQLEKSGLLYLSTMEDDYRRSGLQGPSSGKSGEAIKMHYYTENDLSDMLISSAFSIKSVNRKRYAGSDNSTTTDLIIIAKK